VLGTVAGMTDATSVSMIIVTHQRLAALRDNLSRHLAVRGVDEVVVVVDGSTDGTIEFLDGIPDPRLRIIRQSRRGQPLSRRVGIQASHGSCVFLIDDDDLVQPDHVEVLIAVTTEHQSDVVGSPRLYVTEARLPEAVARGRANPVHSVTFGTPIDRFPPTEFETPFICSTALVCRRVFDRVQFDPGYRGNAWREETDFFVSAASAGFKVMLTPRTFSFCPRRWPGGHRRSWFWYTWWCWRNNGRFVRKHRAWLRQHGLPSNLAVAQLRYGVELLLRPFVKGLKVLARSARPS
jgi:GT2 family glycosyltransferase